MSGDVTTQDLTQSPRTILVNLINQENLIYLPTPLTTETISFNDPISYGGDGANTMIVVGTTDPATYGAGTVPVHYTRVDLAALPAAQPALPDNALTVAGILSAFNSTYSLNLTGDNITQSTNQALTKNEDGTYTQQITIVDADLIYMGTNIFTFAAEPVGVPAASFTETSEGLVATFTDASTTTNGATVTGWSWDFGDGGTSAVQNPTHTYASTGSYTVALTVTDSTAQTNQASQSITIKGQPVASFTSSVNHQAVTFTDTSTDLPGTSIDQWAWDFGDGGSATTQNPSHTYASAGSFTVKLTVTDGTGSTASKSATVVTVGTPVAAFTSSVTNLDVTFTDTSTDDGSTITGWAWDFGDGGTSAVQNPTHTYASAGTFSVKLTVTDASGSTADVTNDVTTTAA